MRRRETAAVWEKARQADSLPVGQHESVNISYGQELAVGQPKKTKHFKRRNAVGDALRRARLAKGLSQAQLSAKLQLLGWDVGLHDVVEN